MYNDREAMNTQREYFNRIGMITNFKKAQSDFEQIKIQNVMVKRLKSGKGAKKRVVMKQPVPKVGAMTSRYNADYSPTKLLTRQSENFSDVLKECIIKDIRK